MQTPFQPNPWRLSLVIALAITALTGTTLALAFAEEIGLYFRDPQTQQLNEDQPVSSFHFDLTYVLALAAGYSATDSITLQTYDQLVDSAVLSATHTYSNCTGAFNPPPQAPLGCRGLLSDPWPMENNLEGPGCFTSRYGVYSPFFHFPRQTPAEIGALHDWAWGITSTLNGYEAYAWDGLTVLEAECTLTRTVPIQTGMQAGSLAAFATYLHSLGDSYSHLDCIQLMDSIGAPWPTHIITAGRYPELNDNPACTYNPNNYQNDDAHGLEFGTLSMTDSLRTDAAIQAIYSELTRRSLRLDGQSFPLDLDASLPGVTGATSLRTALERYVHAWGYDDLEPSGTAAANRRAFLDEVAAAIQVLPRVPIQRSFLPLSTR